MAVATAKPLSQPKKFKLAEPFLFPRAAANMATLAANFWPFSRLIQQKWP